MSSAVHLPFNVVRPSMYKWRRFRTPCIPQTLVQLGEILNNGQWPKYSVCDGGPFYSGTVLATNGAAAVVFGNAVYINQFANAQYVFIDGTFKAVPRKPKFLQILTIFATSMDHVSH